MLKTVTEQEFISAVRLSKYSNKFSLEGLQGVKPELGRTTNGNPSGVDAITNRVDRLRLCGNGVVPQQAAKAFIVLSKLFNQESEVI